MNYLKSIPFFYAFALILTVSTFVACGDDDEPEVTQMEESIVDIAVSDSDLSILVEALTSANLVNALSAEGPFTVFAPSNAAFVALLDSNPDWNVLSDIPNDVLSQVLLFHVVPSRIEAADLSNTYVNTLNTGSLGEAISLQVNVDGGVTFNGDAIPTATDIEASNGIIHKIDRVMLPPNVVNLALNNGAFSTLVAALTDDRHTTDFVGLLSGEGPFTVFAPTNDAFQALLDSNADWNSLIDIPIETLDAVLKYHVVGGANVRSTDLVDGQEVTMFSDDTATIDLSNGPKIMTSSIQEVGIIILDVQGSNGVVHAIDTVMLP